MYTTQTRTCKSELQTVKPLNNCKQFKQEHQTHLHIYNGQVCCETNCSGLSYLGLNKTKLLLRVWGRQSTMCVCDGVCVNVTMVLLQPAGLNLCRSTDVQYISNYTQIQKTQNASTIGNATDWILHTLTLPTTMWCTKQ